MAEVGASEQLCGHPSNHIGKLLFECFGMKGDDLLRDRFAEWFPTALFLHPRAKEWTVFPDIKSLLESLPLEFVFA